MCRTYGQFAKNEQIITFRDCFSQFFFFLSLLERWIAGRSSDWTVQFGIQTLGPKLWRIWPDWSRALSKLVEARVPIQDTLPAFQVWHISES